MHMYAEKEKYMRFGQWARVLCAESPCLFTLAWVHVGSVLLLQQNANFLVTIKSSPYFIFL